MAVVAGLGHHCLGCLCWLQVVLLHPALKDEGQYLLRGSLQVVGEDAEVGDLAAGVDGSYFDLPQQFVLGPRLLFPVELVAPGGARFIATFVQGEAALGLCDGPRGLLVTLLPGDEVMR